MNWSNQSTNLYQNNYTQIQNINSIDRGITKDSIFDVLWENCYDILGRPYRKSIYSETLGYYSLPDGRLQRFFKKMQNKYGKMKLKSVMSIEEKNIYNRLCTCGRCRKCLSNYV